MPPIKHMLDAKGTDIYEPAIPVHNVFPKVKEVRFDPNAYPYFTFERDSTTKEMSFQIIVNDTDCQVEFQLSNNGTEFSTVIHNDLPLVFADGVRSNGHIEFGNLGAKFVRLVFSINSSSADPYFCVFLGDD